MSEHEGPPSASGTPGDSSRFDDLAHKLDTVAGATAAVAATQRELLDLAAAQRADLALALEALATVAERLDRSEGRTEDRLAAIRDAALAPVADLQALLAARSERTEAQLGALADRVEAALEDLVTATGPSPTDEPPTAAGATAGGGEALAERVEELHQAIGGLSWQLPELAGDLASLRERLEGADAPAGAEVDVEGLAEDLRNHTTAALAGTLRVLDQRFESLRSALAVPPPAAPSGGMSFEAGAVMGAAQAAWTRLEQRLDAEFDDLGRQLAAMAAAVEHAMTTAEAAANRPVVTGEQLKRTATSLKDAVVQAGRARRDRRAGPRSLGPG